MPRRFESRVLDFSGGLRSGVSEYGRKCRHFTKAENVEFRPYGSVQVRKGTQKLVDGIMAARPHTIMEWVSSAGTSHKFIGCDDLTFSSVGSSSYVEETSPFTLTGKPFVWDQLDGTLWATEYGGAEELMSYRSSNPADTFLSGNLPYPATVCASHVGSTGGSMTINAAYQYRLRWIFSTGGSLSTRSAVAVPAPLKVGVWPTIGAGTAITAIAGQISPATTVLNAVTDGDLSVTMSANAIGNSTQAVTIGATTYPAVKITSGSAVLTLNQGTQTLTTLAVSTRTSDFLCWILERTVANGEVFYFLAQGAAANYVDTASDSDLGYEADELHYGQLPNGHVDGVMAMNDRLLAWQGSTVYLSQPIGMADGSGINNWDARNAYDFGKDDGDTITAVCKQADRYTVLKQHAIWALEGNDPSNYRAVHVYQGVGCAGPRAAAFMGAAGWFHGAAGLHQIVNNTIRPFGYVEVGDVLATFSKARFPDVVIRAHVGQRVLMAFSAGGVENDTILVYDQRFGTWQVWNNLYAADILCPRIADYGDQESFLYIDPRNRGDAGDPEYRSFIGFFGDGDEKEVDGTGGLAVPMVLQTPWLDDGLPDVVKSLKRLQMYLKGTDFVVRVTVEVDPPLPSASFLADSPSAGLLWGDGRLWGDGTLWTSAVSDSGRTIGLPQGLIGRRYRLTFSADATAGGVFKGFVTDGILQPERRASTL